MNRELAKKKAMSRDCHCVKGKDRDNNYNSIIDEIFDWHESEVKKLSIHGVSKSFYCQHELVLDCKEQCFKCHKLAGNNPYK